MMKFFRGLISQIRRLSKQISISILVSLFIALISRDKLTRLLFSGKSFSGRSFGHQFILFSFYFLAITLLIFVFFLLLNALFPKVSNRIIQPSVSSHNLQEVWIGSIKKWGDTLFKWRNSLQHNYFMRLSVGLLILGIGFSFMLLINNVLSTINTKTWHYEKLEAIPAESPIGIDFRLGSYQTARALVDSGFTQIRMDGVYYSIYPPLFNLLSLPYLLFSENNAYLIQVVLLFLTNLSCLVLVSLMTKEFVLSNIKVENKYLSILVSFIFITLLIYTFSSYGFLFSIERGNTDIFALFFSLLAIWIFLKYPEKIWIQVILLSIAAHLKIYPSVLFLLLSVTCLFIKKEYLKL